MRPLALCRAVLAVLAAFIGIRARKNADSDAEMLRPVHFVLAGIIAVALFIATLLTLVQFIV